MEYNNPAVKHAEALKKMNDDFSTCEIVFKKDGIVFSTNLVNSWSVVRGEETLYIEPNGFEGFLVKRKTKYAEDLIELLMVTNDYSRKYRNGDLYHLIQNSFGLAPITDKSDISKNDTQRFFNLNYKLLLFLDLSPDLLLEINPNNMHSITLADLMYSLVGKIVLRLKENQQAVTELAGIMMEYDEVNRQNQHDEKKFYILLDGLERISNKYL